MNDNSKKNVHWCRKPLVKKPSIHVDFPSCNALEGYIANYAQGVISIKENSLLNASYGARFLNSVLPSGHWPEWSGNVQPLFALRPIWVDCDPLSWLAAKDDAALNALSAEIHEMGYNALILGGVEAAYTPSVDALKPHLPRFLEILNRKKIRLVLNLSGWLKDSENQTETIKTIDLILKEIQNLPAILIRSQVDPEELNRERKKTYLEMLSHEIAFFERVSKGKFELIYYLPYNKNKMDLQANFLQNLTLNISPKTILAFSAVAGCPTQDHLPAHPFWEELRGMHEVLGTRLLPIIQVADPKWPAFPFDVFEGYFSRCHRHNFIGIAAYTTHVPAKEDLQHGNLWVAAQMQWRLFSASMCLETWFKTFRPHLKFYPCFELLRQIRELTVEINKLESECLKSIYQSDEIRLIHDTFMSRLKILELKIEKKQIHNELSKKFDFELKLYLNAAEKKLLESANLMGISLNKACIKQ